VAVAAGAGWDLALRIGVSMTLLQLGIGTVNDVVDAPRDAGRKPGKPIPAGLVGRQAAGLLALAAFFGGGALAASVSLALGALAVVVIAIGLSYDLRLKGTVWSWLPFAIGIPILPVYGWLGAAGTLPPAFAVLVPVAMVAGAALAIGNALVDVERDEAAGVTSIAAGLGVNRAAATTSLLLAAVLGAAVGTAAVVGRPIGTVALLGLLGAIPVVASLRAGERDSRGRELSWRAEAVGLAALAAAWVALVLAPDG
jgi:geranylgeranylglycerol-phosphate geranylgeranyltransferase